MVTVADFREQACPTVDVVLVDPPFGIGKIYLGEKETVPYEEWVTTLYDWSRDSCGWLLILGPFITMATWLPKVPQPTTLLAWHRTFVLPMNVKYWTKSITPVLVYNFGGAWYGPTKTDRKFHDCIDAHSSMGDIQRQKKLGLHSQTKGHPAITGTDFPQKVLSPIVVPGSRVFDPMAGIGSVLVAAQRLECIVGGYEIVPEWAELANEWLYLEKGLLNTMRSDLNNGKQATSAKTSM